jgi:hypothetical protein
MKYLSKFKLFESVEDTIEDDIDYMKTMLVELEDSGCSVNIKKKVGSNTVVIDIKNSDNYLLLDDVIDKVNQILSILPNYKKAPNIKSGGINNSFFNMVIEDVHLDMNFFQFDHMDSKIITSYILDHLFIKYKRNLKYYYFSVFDPGMQTWQDDLILNNIEGDRYEFDSEDPMDDFSIALSKDELSDKDVRMPITYIKILLLKD